MNSSRTILARLAGALWLAIGVLLAARGLEMLLVRAPAESPPPSELARLAAAVLGLLAGWLKGRTVLAKAARRNLARIAKLERPRPWQALPPRLLVAIPIMVLLGLALRAAAARGWLGGWAVAGGIYLGIGAALAVSAFVYFLPPPPRLLLDAREPPPPRPRRTGLLLVNLGTPSAPTPSAVRRYLREFLSDPRVIEVDRALWWVVLRVFVLPRRAGKVAEAYRAIWMEQGSPLAVHTRRQASALAARLGPDWSVEPAMRYGEPSLAAALERLRAAGADPVRVLPLFPQASNTTTGSVQAELARLSSARRDPPALQLLPAFPEDPGYVAALAARVREARSAEPAAPPAHHLFSFHGLPAAYVRHGDPYAEQCVRTAWALARELGLARDGWTLAFQSRFGDEPWLEPYLDELLPELARRHPRVVVVLPGFAADCLETLEEIGIRAREQFLAAGGQEFVVVPALNDHPAWIEALAGLARGDPAEPRRPAAAGAREPAARVLGGPARRDSQ